MKKENTTKVTQLTLIALMALLGETACTAPVPLPPPEPFLNQQALVDSMLNNMVFVQGGSYKMGTDDPQYAESDNTPAHRVILSSFYMSKYLTSGQQLDSYLELTNQSKKMPDSIAYEYRDHYPAQHNWQTVHQYCVWLSQKTGLPFSLPTEAQWEYAARDRGQDIAYPTDNGKLEMGKNYPDKNDLYLGGKVTYKDNGLYDADVVVVTAYPVNKLGIHQLGGNVREWMNDWYSPYYYSESPVNNPQGPNQSDSAGSQPLEGAAKVLRGIPVYTYYEGTPGPAEELSTYARDYTSITSDTDAHNASDTIVGEGTDDAIFGAGFRCVINSDKPLSELKAEAQTHQQKSQ